MKDKSGVIIYVGKARSLKKRVSSYFRDISKRDLKTGILVKKIVSFDTILTSTEKEALILESNLIKKHKPRYNVILKDGKRYPSLRIDVRQAYPRLEVVRKVKKDGAVYFGPYTTSAGLKQTLKTINRTFLLRKCKHKALPKRDRPCLNFQLARCLGPCCHKVDNDAYLDMVNEVILFLKGRAPDLMRKIQEQMNICSQSQEYEQAARLRDRMFAIKATVERQVAITTDFVDRDVLGISQGPGGTVITVLYVRGGFLMGTRNFGFDEVLGSESQSVQAFIRQYYDKDRFMPDEVVLPGAVDDMELMEQWLTEIGQKRVALLWPQRGEKVRLVDMANDNAKDALKLRLSSEKVFRQLLKKVQKRLKLGSLPHRIECFDISHTAGNQAVGSMVVFEDGKAINRKYRSFTIKNVSGPDDYAAMHEVLSRRFLSEKAGSEPDFLLIDGGRGQVSIAVSVLKSLGRDNIPVFGIAKKNKARMETSDKVYKPGQANPIVFGLDLDVLLYLQKIRDEAHRFAITLHRKKRGKAIRRSVLDDIPGIGEKRKKALLRHFGSVKRICQAKEDELARVSAMNKKAAKALFEALGPAGP